MAYLIRLPRQVRHAAARSKIPSMVRSALAFHPSSAPKRGSAAEETPPRRRFHTSPIHRRDDGGGGPDRDSQRSRAGGEGGERFKKALLALSGLGFVFNLGLIMVYLV